MNNALSTTTTIACLHDLLFNEAEARAADIIDALPTLTDEHLLETRRRAKDLGQVAWKIECAADAEILNRTKAKTGRGNIDSEGAGVTSAVRDAADKLGVSERTIFLNAKIHKVISEAEKTTENVFSSLDKSHVIAALGAENTTAALEAIVKEHDADRSFSARDAKRLVASMKVKRADVPLPEGKFQIILADPPWRYDFGNSDNRIIENHYPTMELADICALDVPSLCADDCTLFLWTTSPKLEETFEVIKAWGFRYKTCMVWDKEMIGMGYYFRQQHELLLVCKRGDLPAPEPSNRVSSVLRAPRGRHSEKPEELYAILEKMYPRASRLELFCRSPRNGWAVWGNEV